MKRLIPLAAVLLGVLPALAAPVPKSVKRDPLWGEWVADQPFDLGSAGYDLFRFDAFTLTLSGWPGREREVAWEVEEDDDGERFLVLLDCGHGRRRHPFTLSADGTLTVRDRVAAAAVTLRRP